MMAEISFFFSSWNTLLILSSATGLTTSVGINPFIFIFFREHFQAKLAWILLLPVLTWSPCRTIQRDTKQ